MTAMRRLPSSLCEVALEAYRYFEMRGKTSEYGRILPPLETGK